MVCYRPLRGWKSAEPNANGKYPIVFSAKKCYSDLRISMVLPCGQCSGCRLERSRQWALRCVHELKCHDSGCFVTLTFNDAALVKRGHSSLAVRDVQLFMKRVRKRFGSGIKFLASGEYGDDYGRPHYHVLLFGANFDADKRYWKMSKSGEKLYTSKRLEKLWSDPATSLPYGYTSVGALTFQSAAYVARYCMKKQVGKLPCNGVYSMSVADLDYRTGRVTPRRSEFGVMSKELGFEWFKRYWREWYRSDSVVFDGREQGIPRYYDRKLEQIDPALLETIKRERVKRAEKYSVDNTDRRLRVRETVTDARLTRLFHGVSVGTDG
jgi:hypothetical protein